MNTHMFPGTGPSTRATTSLGGFAARTPPAQPVGFGALLAALVGLVIKPAGENPEAAAMAGGEAGDPGAEAASTHEDEGNGATGAATPADGQETGKPAATDAAGKAAQPSIPGVAGTPASAMAVSGPSGTPVQGTERNAAGRTTLAVGQSPAAANGTGKGIGNGPASANGAGISTGAAADNAVSVGSAAVGNRTAAADNPAAAGLTPTSTDGSPEPAHASGESAHSRNARRRMHAADGEDGGRPGETAANPTMPPAIPTVQEAGTAPAGANDPKAADEGGSAHAKGRTGRAGGRGPSGTREGDGFPMRRPGSPARQSAGTPARGVAAGVRDGGAAGTGTMADARSDIRMRLHAASQVVTGPSSAVASPVDGSQTSDSPALRSGVHSVPADGAPAPLPHPHATQNGAGAYAAAQVTANGTQDGNDTGSDTASRDHRSEDGAGGRAGASQSRGADAPVLGVSRTAFRSSVQGPSTSGHTDGTPSMQAHHVDRIAHVQDAQAARPPHQVILHVEDADGVTSRVKVALRGVRVGTQIDTAVAAAGELRARTGELRRALDRHGLRADGVQIRPVTSDPVPAAVNDRHTGAAGGHAQGRNEGRPQSHGRPDGQRRHQDQRPGEGRDQKEGS